ncbi:tyrosine-type recombinase/integrase [Caenispirillum bisanense]|uniref:tyrosine-type recombinase/integrase n=1 Tax=Caenispirillum bisanense TaxID=414052 RepID=UPI0031D7499F
MRKLPYVHRYRDRHGRLRHYYRRPGCKSVPLPGSPGSAEFMAAYEAALRGQDVARPEIGQGRTKPGSIAALIAKYYRSAEWAGLKDSTKNTYRGILERFKAAHGDKPVKLLEKKHVRAMVAEKAATPAAANNLLRMLRLLMRFAIEEDFRADDPTVGVKSVRYVTDGFHTWTEDEIARFERTYPVGTRERLALALALYTGQRRSDLVRMGRQHVRGDRIRVKQVKTGKELWIPLHPSLAEILAQTPVDNMTFLTTGQGKPYTAAGFGNWFGDAARAAGLQGCAVHGLRKAAARRLAEAGCTPHEIAAITGHKTLKEVERYTLAADQERLAASAMERIAHGQLANHPEQLAKPSRKRMKRKGS